MDFIEKLFGLSPDNGDGSTEVMWLVALALAACRAYVLYGGAYGPRYQKIEEHQNRPSGRQRIHGRARLRAGVVVPLAVQWRAA